MDIDKIKQSLESRLSEKRYRHSVGVMNAAKELAILYGEDENEAEFAGLIHDIAKELTKEEIEDYLKRYNIEIDDIEKKSMGLLHSKIGAIIAKEEFDASLKVQNAIKYHTTGNVKMDTFAKIIYIADKIEENRKYEGVEHHRDDAKQDLDIAMLNMIDHIIEKSIKEKKLIHPDSTDLRNLLLETTKIDNLR